MDYSIEEIKSELSKLNLSNNTVDNNGRYHLIPDELIIDFIRLRLSNERYSIHITTVDIIKRVNKNNEPYYVSFILNAHKLSFERESGIMFTKFFPNEIDWMCKVFEMMHMYPICECVGKLREEVVDLKCSNAGWLSRYKSLKKQLSDIANSIKL